MQGPSGPRRGNALGDIGAIADGAILIRNGVIEQCGSSRRVENLSTARKAREIDLAGKVVLPAFVDADSVLACPLLSSRRSLDPPSETPLRLVSRRRLNTAVDSAATEMVRSGFLTVAAHTGYAADLRDTLKVLRAQQGTLGKLLRIGPY